MTPRPHAVDVVSFDRDLTVDIGMAPGPVPLEWVKELVFTDPVVYAHGNQKLVDEADALGLDYVTENVTDWNTGTHPEVNLSRLDRLRLIGRLHPDAERCYAVDDAFKLGVDPADVPEPWEVFTPQGFVDEFDGVFGGGRIVLGEDRRGESP